MKEAWPSDQGTDAIQTEAPNEDGFVAEMSKDPIRVAERGERIGP